MPRRDVESSRMDLVEEAGSESFPASDPPGWTPLHAGGGERRRTQEPGSPKEKPRRRLGGATSRREARAPKGKG